MIDINLIRNNKEEVIKKLSKRMDNVNFDEVLENDRLKRELVLKIDTLKSERNKVSAMVPVMKKENKDVTEVFAEMKKLGEEIAKGDEQIKALDTKINDFLCRLPNIPDDDLVAGGKENNQVIYTFGNKPEFNFKPKNHVELCTNLGLIDYERGTKLAGNGYWIYRGLGAKLEWALLNYFVEEHLNDGYEFILPPHMLGYNCGYGAGQFPKFNDEVYQIKQEETDGIKFMLPTAETALVNMYSGEIIPEDKLPLKLFAYTPCYRKEAGSYRSEERGMIRGHQFNKVEMVHYATQEQSKQSFEELVNKAQNLVKKLGLHYQVSKLAAGDVSHSMARTYDIEVWIPSMGIYKEVSSVSNANDYQARRNGTRYKTKDGKNLYCHTLNGSGLATSRIIPAIVEQFQNEDGSVTIPEVLRKYLGGLERISK